MMVYRSAILILGMTFLVSAASVHADSVYKSQGEGGKVIYSSKPPTKDAKPAQLPPIMRGEVKLGESRLVTCDKHGGINCQAGPDSDGSVICYDGYKDVSARYRFTCNSPKLEITEITDVTQQGTFTVLVRNSKSVVAKKPALFFKPEGAQEVKLKGPDEIDAFGVAEFEYTSTSDKGLKEKPSMASLTLTCANCP